MAFFWEMGEEDMAHQGKNRYAQYIGECGKAYGDNNKNPIYLGSQGDASAYYKENILAKIILMEQELS